MRHAAGPRRELGIPTVFNVLGPLTNPAQPTYAAVGVADARMAPLVAGVFAERGKDTAVFRGDDGLDELTVSTTSTVWWVRGGEVAVLTLDPDELGVARSPLSSLRGGDPEHNAAVVREVLSGAPGPVRDAVVLNAGIALAVVSGGGARRHEDVVAAVRVGMGRAREALDSGRAGATLARWAQATKAFAP
jgi:anthranilate phosphoribosyltransferase